MRAILKAQQLPCGAERVVGNMQRRVRGANIRRSNTKPIVNGVVVLACVPVFCSLANAPVAGALSLTGTVGELTQPLRQPVRDLTTPVIDTLRGKQTQPVKAVTDTVRSTTQQLTPPAPTAAPTSPAPTPTPTTTSTSRTAPSTSQPRSSASTTSESTTTAPSIEPAAMSSEESENPVEPVMSPLRLFNPNLSLQQPRWGTFEQASVASATFMGITTQGATRESRYSWLQPSPTGWRLLGIEWFWWLLAIAPISLGVAKRKKLLLPLRTKYGRVDPK